MHGIRKRDAVHFIILLAVIFALGATPLTIEESAAAKLEERTLKPVHGSIVDPEDRVRVGAAQIVLSANRVVFQFTAESLTIWCDLSGANSVPLQIALVTLSGDTPYKRAGMASVEVIAGSEEHSHDVTALFGPGQWRQASGFKFRMVGVAHC